MASETRKNYKFLNISPDEEVLKRLNDFCDKYGFTKTKVTEMALMQYIDNYEKTHLSIDLDVEKQDPEQLAARMIAYAEKLLALKKDQK
jgi:antitoxin component of RelBE/YafQ-DinJ toxin-antitoxin module